MPAHMAFRSLCLLVSDGSKVHRLLAAGNRSGSSWAKLTCQEWEKWAMVTLRKLQKEIFAERERSKDKRTIAYAPRGEWGEGHCGVYDSSPSVLPWFRSRITLCVDGGESSLPTAFAPLQISSSFVAAPIFAPCSLSLPLSRPKLKIQSTAEKEKTSKAFHDFRQYQQPSYSFTLHF